jgi:hypothetical protein
MVILIFLLGGSVVMGEIIVFTRLATTKKTADFFMSFQVAEPVGLVEEKICSSPSSGRSILFKIRLADAANEITTGI